MRLGLQDNPSMLNVELTQRFLGTPAQCTALLRAIVIRKIIVTCSPASSVSTVACPPSTPRRARTPSNKPRSGPRLTI